MKTTTRSTSRSTRTSAAKRQSGTVKPLGALKRTTPREKLNENTWVVFRKSNERKPLLFEARLTRDQVRCAYSRITGVSHDKTRSRRLRNY